MTSVKHQTKHSLAHEKVECDLLTLLAEQNPLPHSPFLSEVEMAEKFNVNVGTARKAVDRLVNKGVLYKVHRKGTFVAPQAKNRLFLIVTTNPEASVVGNLTPVADQYPDLQWQEVTAESLRLHIEDIEHVFPRLTGVLFIRDCPRCIDLIRALSKKNIPVFFYGSDVHLSKLEGCHALLSKESYITELALNHLKAQGCKRIACLGERGWAAIDARIKLYSEWVTANGFPNDPQLILDQYPSSDFSHCYFALCEGFRSGAINVDGIYCPADNYAAIVTQAALACGLKIPSDLAIVTVEDNSYLSTRIFPQISAVCIPMGDDIQQAFRLLSRLSEGNSQECMRSWSKPFLIHRPSS